MSEKTSHQPSGVILKEDVDPHEKDVVPPKNASETAKKQEKVEEGTPASSETPLASSKKSPEKGEDRDPTGTQTEMAGDPSQIIPKTGPGANVTSNVSGEKPVRPKSKLNLGKLREIVEKKSPDNEEDIPDFLYTPGTRSHDAAKIIVFEGITDAKTISKRTGLAKKTASMIRGAIFKSAEDLR